MLNNISVLRENNNGWDVFKYDRLANNVNFFFENVPYSKRNIIMLITDNPPD